jgi:hypothetical protein
MKLINAIRQIRLNVLLIWKSLINIYLLKRETPWLPIYTYKGLIKSIERRGDICHIIATGYSALDAYKKKIIKANEYIIGMNFAAFLPYKFDFYFVEYIYDKEKYSKQIFLLEKYKERISRLVFKNIYMSEPDVLSSISSNIKYSIVLDTQVIVSVDVAKVLFNKPAILMPQCCSTVITATMLAYHMGFKNIIIHGLDFSGPYIYHDKELQEQVGIYPPEPLVSQDVAHLTKSIQELIWPRLINYFLERDIGIYCASSESNFKKYAHIWDESSRSCKRLLEVVL